MTLPYVSRAGCTEGKAGLAEASWVVFPQRWRGPNALVLPGVSLELYQPERLEGDDESAYFLCSSRSRNVLKSCLYPGLSTFL